MIRHYYPGVFHVARELFDELRRYSGSAASRDVLAPWIEKRGPMMVELLASLAVYRDWRREEYRWADPLEQAYALSRVNDVLLLGFQPALPVGSELPWAHDLHPDIRWIRKPRGRGTHRRARRRFHLALPGGASA